MFAWQAPPRSRIRKRLSRGIFSKNCRSPLLRRSISAGCGERVGDRTDRVNSLDSTPEPPVGAPLPARKSWPGRKRLRNFSCNTSPPLPAWAESAGLAWLPPACQLRFARIAPCHLQGWLGRSLRWLGGGVLPGVRFLPRFKDIDAPLKIRPVFDHDARGAEIAQQGPSLSDLNLVGGLHITVQGPQHDNLSRRNVGVHLAVRSYSQAVISQFDRSPHLAIYV